MTVNPNAPSRRPRARRLRSIPLWLLGSALAWPTGALGQDVATPQQACNDGDPTACYELGTMFLTGEGVERDPLRAGVYFERACNEGALEACGALALMHLRGQGVAPDSRRAVALLERACDGGESSACANLGTLYAEGGLVGQDLELASEYFRRACDAGHLSGCANLGLLYERGAGVEEDPEQAREYFRTACRGGLSAACSFLTGQSWELVAYDSGQESPGASVRSRAAAGGPATLTVSCTPGRADVVFEWVGSQVEQRPLTTRVGPETAGGDAWELDDNTGQYRYVGDARALLSVLLRFETQALFASTESASASFTLDGLAEMVAPLEEACRW